MYLNDRLRVCLLALTSRYPGHVVDINEALLGPQELGALGWTALDVIELLERERPDILLAEAYMVVSPQKCEIYLPTYSEKVPAFHIHCRGRIPLYGGNIASRRALSTV